MESYFCKCKIITPLFMGGANQQPEIRTQSINGVLRWWFRIAGGSVEDEKRIFGWAGETSNQGLARIYLKEPDFSPQNFASTAGNNQNEGYNYLGFSLRMTNRQCVPVGQTFEMKISFHPKSGEDDFKKFFCSLWLAFNLGNFGSRARRGFGSIKIEKIEKVKEDVTKNCFGLDFVSNTDLKSWISRNFGNIKKILNSNPRTDIPYLFDNFEIYEFKFESVKNKNWKDLLDELGQEYKNFRRNYKLDERIVFGLPIVSVAKYRVLRRASPLIFKIIEINKNNYALILIIMKPKERKFIFLPDEENVNWNLLSQFIESKTNLQRIYPC